MKFLFCISLLTCCLHFSSCESTKPNPIGVVLGPSQTRLDEKGIPFEIQVNLSSPASADEELIIVISDSTTQYGREYTTVPDGSSKTISLTIFKGFSTASFLVVPRQNSASEGDKTVKFLLSKVSNRLMTGSSGKSTVTFLDTDLFLFLPFSGNSFDRSYYLNPTTLFGATLLSDRNNASSSAYSFDGIQNSISIQNSDLLNTIQNITLCAWVRPVSFTGVGNNAILEKPFTSHSNPFYQYKLGVTGDSFSNLPASFIFSLAINGSYNFVSTNSNAWNPNNWYFVVGTYDGSIMRLYVNGIQVAVKAASGSISGYGQNLYIGKVSNINKFTPGIFDDIRIYNRALVPSEIQGLFSR